jgi:hypothetical protein
MSTTEASKEPSIVEMRMSLAEDAQTRRYSHSVLVAFMRALEEVADSRPPLKDSPQPTATVTIQGGN